MGSPPTILSCGSTLAVNKPSPAPNTPPRTQAIPALKGHDSTTRCRRCSSNGVSGPINILRGLQLFLRSATVYLKKSKHVSVKYSYYPLSSAKRFFSSEYCKCVKFYLMIVISSCFRQARLLAGRYPIISLIKSTYGDGL